MEVELVHLNPILLGGLSFYGDPISTKCGWDSENEIGKTWSRFMDFLAAHPQRSYSYNRSNMYEIHIYGRETDTKGYFEVFVGEEVSMAQLPVELSSKFIPESDYIKITLFGNEITSDWWLKLDSDILPAKGVRRSSSYIIQAYDERFKGMDNIDKSIMDAYIPVEAL